MSYPKIPVWQGKTITIEFDIKQSSDAEAPAVDLTDARALFLMKDDLDDDDSLAVVRKTHTDGIAIYDPTGGKGRITIDGEDTAVLEFINTETYPCQVGVRTANGSIVVSAVFVLQLRESVIKEMI